MITITLPAWLAWLLAVVLVLELPLSLWRLVVARRGAKVARQHLDAARVLTALEAARNVIAMVGATSPCAAAETHKGDEALEAEADADLERKVAEVEGSGGSDADPA